jgi:hypothetical protein
LESKQIGDQSPRVRYPFEKSFQWVASLGFGTFGTRFWSLRGWMKGRDRWRVLIYGLWVVRWEWKRRYILGWDAKNLVCQRYYYREREYVYDHFFHESRWWGLVEWFIKRQNRSRSFEAIPRQIQFVPNNQFSNSLPWEYVVCTIISPSSHPKEGTVL